jgi:hypothetical protein
VTGAPADRHRFPLLIGQFLFIIGRQSVFSDKAFLIPEKSSRPTQQAEGTRSLSIRVEEDGMPLFLNPRNPPSVREKAYLLS